LLNGKRVLITGANGGIGLASCESLLQTGARLVLFFHKSRNGIDEIIKRNPTLAENIETYQVDLLDHGQVMSSLSKVSDAGNIDIFVHSVALPLEMKGFTSLEWSDFQQELDIQTKSFFWIVQQIAPSMKERKYGKIINVLTSAVIGKPPTNMSNYLVGKYSSLGLSRSLAVELGRFGITVNCVSPSTVNTPLIANFPKSMLEISKSQTPLGRLAEAKDVAKTIVFLSSDDSNYITGENIIVSGGQVID